MAYSIIAFAASPHLLFTSSSSSSWSSPPLPLLLCRSKISPPSAATPVGMMHRLRRRATKFYAAVDSSEPSADSRQEDKDDQRVGPDIRTLLRRFWKIAAPYWLSEDKVQDRLRLAAVFALTLATTGISVGFNFLGRDFYNALANKDQEQFTKQLLYYLGAFAVGIPFFVLRDYSKETLSLRWRSWMTSYYISRYFKNQKFYKIQSQSIIDNPDQRIVDDLSSFTGIALSFSLTLLNAAVDLISFSNILYGIYPPLFIILLVYSLGGTALSVFLGKGLVNLNFMQEKKEADFRYGLVRARENAESIAFYGGEKNEMQLLLERFRRAYENLTDLLITSRNLEFFTNGYRYLIQILPVAVVAPMYFSGKIEFGVINQSASAFNHILSDFSLVVYQFQALSAFSAVIDRLGEFDDILDDNQSYTYYGSPGKINIFFKDRKYADSCVSNGSLNLVECHKLLDIQNLTLQTPRGGNVLITDLSLEIIDKDHLLVMGPSGSGKTSFLRALAGLWDTGEGNITFYLKDAGECEMPASSDSYSSQTMDASQKDEELEEIKVKRPRGLFFLPQRPYMVLGTLRQQLLYPTWSDHKLLSSIDGSTLEESLQDVVGKPKMPTDDEMIQVLKTVYLEDLLSNFKGLDSVNEWSSVLSLGEQQRLAFARLLLSKPEFVLLDESTSALDNANEAHLYKQIEAAGITYISIGHRNTLYNYHKKVLYIEKFESRDSNRRNWNVMPIDKRDKIEANTSS